MAGGSVCQFVRDMACMLEVWHSKTVKQFVKTTEKHWGIGTVSQRPVMATCLTQALALGAAFLPPQVHPQPSCSWRPPPISSLFARSLCVPQHSPLAPPGRSSITKKDYSPALLPWLSGFASFSLLSNRSHPVPPNLGCVRS